MGKEKEGPVVNQSPADILARAFACLRQIRSAFVCVCVCVCLPHVYGCPQRLEELQVIVSCLVCVLKLNLGPLKAGVLNH